MANLTAIQGAELANFLDEADSRKTSVIVEARRPALSGTKLLARQRVTTSPRELLPASFGKLKQNAEAPKKQPFGQTMVSIEKALKKLGLERQARRNDLSGSFVVEVTPAQLRELAGTPAVQAIRPNKLHRSPGA